MLPLYKVLKDGRSCSGGSFTWSLPELFGRDLGGAGLVADFHPGAWHEVAGEIKLCENGFHITENPGHWWVDGCIVYAVQYEGPMVGIHAKKEKMAVARVRLLRPVTCIKIPGGWLVDADESRSSGWSDPRRAD